MVGFLWVETQKGHAVTAQPKLYKKKIQSYEAIEPTISNLVPKCR